MFVQPVPASRRRGGDKRNGLPGAAADKDSSASARGAVVYSLCKALVNAGLPAVLEQDIRLAAGVLRQITDPPLPLALLPALHQEIESAAAFCGDAATARRLRKLIGGDN
jgi:hypothetical protein